MFSGFDDFVLGFDDMYYNPSFPNLFIAIVLIDSNYLRLFIIDRYGIFLSIIVTKIQSWRKISVDITLRYHKRKIIFNVRTV
jgi:hypothetical protein